MDWWRVGHFPSSRCLKQWVCAGDDGDRYEYRVFPSGCWVVAVLRERRWQKIVACECGRRETVSRLTSVEFREATMSFLKRVIPVGGGKGEAQPFPDERFQKKWPAVYEYMTASVDEDGKERKASSLTLFAEDGSLKACFTEKNANAVLFVAGKTLEALLTALEGLLTAQDTPWRRSTGGMATKPKK